MGSGCPWGGLTDELDLGSETEELQDDFWASNLSTWEALTWAGEDGAGSVL